MPPTEAGTTRIQLCGRLKADVSGRHVTPQLRGRQGRVLLAYLVLNRGRPVSRDELIAAIWPRTPPVDPAASLRTQLSRLRSALGAEALAGRDAVELRLPENTWIDLEAAERSILSADSALKASDWKDGWAQAHIALNISGRPFLAGFDAPWVDDVRRELEELHLRSREVIARAGIGLGGSELAGAERAARALIRLAPFRESGYLLLMRALVASGNTAEALRTYDELRNLLAEELGSAPGAEVQALHRRLLGGEDAISPSRPAAPSTTARPGPKAAERPADLPLPTWLVPRRRSQFIGRAQELEHLAEIWEESRAGGRSIVLVGGDPGVGKTRLATEFAARTHAGGDGVLYGRADEEGSFAYQPFVEVLRHWAINAAAAEVEAGLGPHAGVLGTLVPEITVRFEHPPKVEPEAAREALFDAVTSTLATISSSRPILLVIDDLHWADAGTLLMLRHIARSPHRSSLMILATYRETEPSDLLAATIADLGRERLFERLHLSGLSVAEVVEMVVSIRGDGREPGLGEAIHEETGGNPFLVEALVDHLAGKAVIPGPTASNRAAIYAGGVPDLVREAVGHRVGELGETAAAVLEEASVIGREFESELLVEVSAHSAEEVVAALERGVSAGLLSDVPGTLDRYAFSHSLLRQTVYSGIPKARRTMLHRRLAEVLERRHGSDPRHLSELAHHFAGGGPASASKALEYAVRAGAGALGGLAFEEAVEHYRGALTAFDASEGGDEALRCELLLALGEAQWRAGDGDGSRQSFSAAARIARGGGDAETLARAALGFSGDGWARLDDGGDDEAPALLEAALAANPEPGALRARLLARLAEALQAGGDWTRAEEVAAEALAGARDGEDRKALAAALIGRWYARSGPDGLQERASLSRELLAVAAQLGDRDVEIHARHLQVAVCLELGDFGELDVAISRHALLADQMKQPAARLHSRSFVAIRALMEGRFAEAERLAAELLEMGTVSEGPTAVQASAQILYLARWEQGRLAELEEPTRDLARRFPSRDLWRAMLAFLLSECGRPSQARAELELLAADRLEERHRDPDWLAELAFSSMAAASLGEAVQAQSLAETLGPYAGRTVVGGRGGAYLSSASHHLGLLALALGRSGEAVEPLEQAVAVNERAGALPWLARARLHLADALAARGAEGDAERAGQLLAEAGRTGEQLHMPALVEETGTGPEPGLSDRPPSQAG